jgi:AraC family transcriptional regulator
LPLDYTIHSVLTDKAELLRSAMSPSGMGLALWERRGGGTVEYRKHDHHTISLYLRGGNFVRHAVGPQTPAPGAHDGRANGAGSPGAICIMPAGSETAWDNKGYVRWLHLYFRSSHLERATGGVASEPPLIAFGCDPAMRELAEHFVLALDWSAEQDLAALDHALDALLARSIVIKRTTSNFRAPGGGLTGAQQRAVEDFVDASLDRRITVAELAEAAGLSARHLSRAFPVSLGMTPYDWVLRRKLDAARDMLNCGRAAQDVAVACGFSSQSHMIRRFRTAFGYTPGAMR